MWWQSTALANHPRLPYIAVLLAVGMVLGSIPGIISHIVLSQQRPTSPWDGRPCIQLPSSATCNGIVPYAPSDYIAVHGRPPESGLCIDENTDHWTAPISTPPDTPAHTYGTIHLWWSPRCQSAFAEVGITIDLLSPRLTATLSMDIPLNKWLKKQTIIYKAEGNDRQIRTSLLWSPGKMVGACGTVTLGRQIYEGCISPQLMQLPSSPIVPDGEGKSSEGENEERKEWSAV